MEATHISHSPPFRGPRAWLVAALLAVACFAAQAESERAQYDEYGMKAACLSNFGKFTTWPDGTFGDAAAPLVIGILGTDPFGSSLEKVAQVRISGRKVVIRRGRNVADMRGCQIVFIAKSERNRIGEILDALKGAAILTVGESEQFTRQGGAIGFWMNGDQVRFDINATAARRAGLQLDAQLQRLAK